MQTETTRTNLYELDGHHFHSDNDTTATFQYASISVLKGTTSPLYKIHDSNPNMETPPEELKEVIATQDNIRKLKKVIRKFDKTIENLLKEIVK